MVARGFAPAETPKPLEPETGAVAIALKPHDLDRRKPERVLRGRVVNEDGDPVARAIVQPDGVRRGQGGQFGGLAGLGIDPLAVTDDDGQFELGVGRDGDAVYVLVKAPFLAPVRPKPLAAGPTPHTIVLGPGVTVTGRVMKGRPLAGVGLGMVLTVRHAEVDLGHFEYGTDRDGRFAFANIPPGQTWRIYGLMESLKGHGSIPVREVRTGAHGSTLDLGDIEVRPGHRLAGRLVLADGKPVPSGTRVIVSRENAWDAQTTTAGPDGEFSFTGLPAAERVKLSTRVRGYHPSPRNASFDLLNQMGLLGTVKGDVDALRFLLDSGEPPGYRQPSREEMDEYNRRRNGPLRGVSDGKAP